MELDTLYNKVCFTLFINNSFWGDDLSLEERSSRIISRIENRLYFFIRLYHHSRYRRLPTC